MNPNKRNKKLLKALGKNLRELRESRGITQVELSAKLNTEQSHISKIESGFSEPSISLLELMAKEFGVKLNILFDFEYD